MGKMSFEEFSAHHETYAQLQTISPMVKLYSAYCWGFKDGENSTPKQPPVVLDVCQVINELQKEVQSLKSQITSMNYDDKHFR